jgi:hypothetical protein
MSLAVQDVKPLLASALVSGSMIGMYEFYIAQAGDEGFDYGESDGNLENAA